MTRPPHARGSPARDMALATPKVRLRQLEASSELQPCSWLPPTPLIVGDEGSALDPSQAEGGKASPRAPMALVGAGWAFSRPMLHSLFL